MSRNIAVILTLIMVCWALAHVSLGLGILAFVLISAGAVTLNR